MKKKISIIIVTYNSENLIYECLDSICKYNDIGDALEIIIVDNKSTNGALMFSNLNEKFGNKIILINNGKNGGYGQGNNVGIRAASAPLIMIMNPDVRLLHPVFSKAVNYFEIYNIAMLGMLQMTSANARGLSFSTKLDYPAVFNVFITVIANKLNYYNSKAMFLSGSCFFIDKSIFTKLGLFDENVFMYGEENDLHHRLNKLKSNNGIIYDKKMSYLHLSENRPLSIKTNVQMLKANLYFCEKNNICKKNCLERFILNAQLFKLIAIMRLNLEQVKFYNEWLNVLKREKIILEE